MWRRFFGIFFLIVGVFLIVLPILGYMATQPTPSPSYDYSAESTATPTTQPIGWNVQFDCCWNQSPFKAKVVVTGDTGVIWEYLNGGDPTSDPTGESASDAVNLASQPVQSLDTQRFNRFSIGTNDKKYLFKGVSLRKGDSITLGRKYYLVLHSNNNVSGAFYWARNEGTKPDGNIYAI